jgi:serine/threonine-protein kinase
MPTAVATPSRGVPPTSPSSRSASGTHAFAPGEVISDRYRIVSPIGRGGMGEVYRADDLKLGQPVSLKFLPPALVEDRTLLERFHAEVRHARQVSHPNVCRVYDIGETEGRPFLSMEYVDGEDLAALLRRIGRLPRAKANQVARQICAGLAAAHDRGVLHRDLKPSNVMIDGDGRVRITDFGLAVRPGEGAGEVAGTPAYMAPEQFEGKPVTVQSDLYSLGLILFEIYTGRRPFDAASFVEWKSKHLSAPPGSPSALEQDIDDAVERAILRCLEKDPTHRPSSALQLAAALPGGDPLAAALAAGETPSPEMVVAAGGEGGIPPRVAWSLLAGLVASIAAVLMIAPFSSDLGLAPLTQGREVLHQRARDMVVRLGYDAGPRDSDSWFIRDYDSMLYLSRRSPSRTWRREISRWGPPVLLGYRQSPQLMVPRNPDSRIGMRDPPLERSGSLLLVVDAAGRLRILEAVPPQVDSAASAPSPDWDQLFALAGLDRAAFREVTPRWVPPTAFDARSEWSGHVPGDPSIPLTVTAAAWRGRPVYFEMRGPWSQPWRMVPRTPARRLQIASASGSLLIALLVIVAFVMARRNLQLGRGDRRGALRLCGFAFVSGMVQWIASAHHVPELVPELDMLFNALGRAFTFSAFLGLAYVALEPYVRRRLPELLIGWARVLDGRLRDPRVGRDVLVGGLLGTLFTIVIQLVNAAPSWFDMSGQTTIPPDFDALAGGRRLLAFLLGAPLGSIAPAFFFFALYFALRLLLRRTPLAIGALTLIAMLISLGGENVLLETPMALVIGILIALVTTRFGLLSAVAFWLYQGMLSQVPLPLDSQAPYVAQSLVVLAVLAGVAAYAFRIALGSRPIFGLALDD